MSTKKPPQKPAPKKRAPALPNTLILLSLAAAGAAVAWRWAAAPAAAAPETPIAAPPPPADAPPADPVAEEGDVFDAGNSVLATDTSFAGLADACASAPPPARAAARAAATPTLAYVTPWHPAGGDAVVAAAAAGLISHVVPVTYQLVSTDPTLPRLAGAPNTTLLAALAALPPALRPAILPRVSYELSQVHTSALLGGLGDTADAALGSIVAEVAAKRYDGVTLDAPTLWAALGSRKGPGARHAADFIIRLGAAVRGAGGKLAMAVPPATVNDVESVYTSTLKTLAPAVDIFSVMTYDYPGGSAPLAWANATASLVANTVGGDKARVLMGVPLYAVRHDPPIPGAARGPRGTATAPAALAALEAAAAPPVARPPTLTWDKATAEHVAIDPAGARVHLPTPAFVAARVARARAEGLGVALWEAGQALPCVWSSEVIG